MDRSAGTVSSVPVEAIRIVNGESAREEPISFGENRSVRRRIRDVRTSPRPRRSARDRNRFD